MAHPKPHSRRGRKVYRRSTAAKRVRWMKFLLSLDRRRN